VLEWEQRRSLRFVIAAVDQFFHSPSCSPVLGAGVEVTVVVGGVVMRSGLTPGRGRSRRCGVSSECSDMASLRVNESHSDVRVTGDTARNAIADRGCTTACGGYVREERGYRGRPSLC
jgi:hypothetical protein